MIADPRLFGACGNGREPDTEPIQKAIDACAAQGGGQVILKAGVYLTGTLHLRSNVVLNVAADARLLGSPNLADYHVDPEQTYAPGIIGPVLVFAKGCSRTGVIGQGAIDGNGASFERKMDTPRPVLVRLRDCTEVELRDLTLRDGASWTVHTIGCRGVQIDNLCIHSVVHVTCDGLDIDGCEDVSVTGCRIVTSDDGVALKATQPGRPCRNVTVRDCWISSYCQAIRAGPESLADISHVRVSDCVIKDTGMGGICVQGAHGGTLSDMVFENVEMDMVSNPVSVRLAGWRDGDTNVKPWFLDDGRWASGRVSGLQFRRIRARVPRRFMEGTPRESMTFKENERTCITLTGTGVTRPEVIVFEDVDVTFPGGGTAEEAARRVPELDRQYPTPYMFGVPPVYGLFARHVDNLALRNVRFRLAAPDARPAVLCEDVTNADLRGLRTEGES